MIQSVPYANEGLGWHQSQDFCCITGCLLPLSWVEVAVMSPKSTWNCLQAHCLMEVDWCLWCWSKGRLFVWFTVLRQIKCYFQHKMCLNLAQGNESFLDTTVCVPTRCLFPFYRELQEWLIIFQYTSLLGNLSWRKSSCDGTCWGHIHKGIKPQEI